MTWQMITWLCQWLQLDEGVLAYASWLYYLYLPALICVLLPLVIVLFLYMSLLWLHVWKWRHKIVESYNYSLWRGAIRSGLSFWDAFGRIWHGFEPEGLPALPKDRGAMLVIFHGVFPLDVFFLLTRIILEWDRPVVLVADRFLWFVPGFRLMLRVMHVTQGSVQACAEALLQGSLVVILPGGVREALFSDQYYSLLWGRRTGFARAAMLAGAPIFPVFTTNIREGICCARIGIGLFRRLYELTRLPIMIPYGYFPVKLRSFIGEPLLPREYSSAEQLAAAVRASMRALIVAKQRLPGSIVCGLLMRFRFFEIALSPKEAA